MFHFAIADLGALQALKATASRILEVKRSSKDNIPLDERLRLLHLGHEFSISDDSCRVAYFVTGLVETGDDSNDGALCDVGKFCDLLERLGRERGMRYQR